MFIIILPKRGFYDFNLKKILDFLINNKEIKYQIVGQDYINISLSGEIYTTQVTFKEAIKRNIRGDCLFIPGGKGILDLYKDNLASAYIGSYENETFFLEKEAILLFLMLGKLYGRTISKLHNLEPSFSNQIFTVDEDVVIDDNLITSRKAYNNFLSKLVIRCLKDRLYKIF